MLRTTPGANFKDNVMGTEIHCPVSKANILYNVLKTGLHLH